MNMLDERDTVSVVPGRDSRGWPLDYWRVSRGDAPLPLTARQSEVTAARFHYSTDAHDAAREAFPEAIIYVG